MLHTSLPTPNLCTLRVLFRLLLGLRFSLIFSLRLHILSLLVCAFVGWMCVGYIVSAYEACKLRKFVGERKKRKNRDAPASLCFASLSVVFSSFSSWGCGCDWLDCASAFDSSSLSSPPTLLSLIPAVPNGSVSSSYIQSE